MIISRYCEETQQWESRILPIESSQLYDFMSGTPVSIAMPQLDEDDQLFVEGYEAGLESLDFSALDDLLDLKEQFG